MCKKIRNVFSSWHYASTHWSSLCCGDVKGFLYGWSLWNHLQFLETSGDMKNAFSTEKKKLAEQSRTHCEGLPK